MQHYWQNLVRNIDIIYKSVRLMHIEKQKVGEIALRLIELLDKMEISSLKSLDSLLGHKMYALGSHDEFVEINMRPSQNSTQAHVLSYIWLGQGIPIEVRINSVLGYSKIILKSHGEVGGYTVFSRDIHGNEMQAKLIDSIDIESIRNELIDLREKLETERR